MGVTYKAFDERLRLPVALKVIAPFREHSLAAQSLFLREARAAARVRHSNVASVLYLNDTPGNFFYAMEFVDGVALEDWLKEQGTAEPLVAVSIAEQIACGLSAIHDQEIIHRDLKPSNVMLVNEPVRASDPGGGGGRARLVKIIDFGLARPIARSETETQSVGFRGTALYASPEQCEENSELDGRSDLYSLGCILFQLLTGLPPFAARSHRELMNLHVSAPAPLEQLAHVPTALRELVGRLLAKRPEDRYPTAAAVISELERCRAELARLPPAALLAAPVPASAPMESAKSWVVNSSTSALRPAAEPIPLHLPTPTPMAPLESPAPIPSPEVTALELAAIPRRVPTAHPIPMLDAPGLDVTGEGAPRRNHRFVIAAAAGIFAVGLAAGLLPRRGSAPAPSPVAAVAPGPVASPIPAAVVKAEPSRKSVAVLPFANLTGGPETAYFADGMHEDILTNLAKLRELRVISRNSVLGFKPDGERNLKKIASALGVTAIVEGTVRRVETKIRVTAQLIDPETGDNLWAEAFDREITDVIAIQSQVALAIAEALKTNLSAGEKSALSEPARANANAYDLFVKARAILKDRRDPRRILTSAESLLEEATELDPTFARAYALLSRVHTLRYDWGHDRTDDRLAKAYAAARRAVQIGGEFAEGNLALGMYFFRGAGDYPRALDHFQRVLAAEPQNADALAAIANVQRRLGRWEESAVNYAAAVRLSPLETNLQYNHANTLRYMRRYQECEAALLDATSRLGPQMLLGFVRGDLFLQWKGDAEPLRQVVGGLTQSDGTDEIRIYQQVRILLLERKYAEARRTVEGSKYNLLDGQWLFISRNGILAEIEEQAGERTKAKALWLAVLDELSPVARTRSDARMLMMLATALAGTGDFEAAKKEADRAIQDPKIANDQFDLPHFLERRALVYLRCGARAEAGQMIEALLARPGELSPELLRASPEWQDLNTPIEARGR